MWSRVRPGSAGTPPAAGGQDGGAPAQVADVMCSDVVVLPAYQSVRRAVARFGADRHGVYPVVDLTGRPVGLVRMSALRRVPPALRSVVRVGQLTSRVDIAATVRPQDPLAVLSGRRARSGPVFVVADGVLVGVVARAGSPGRAAAAGAR